MDKKKVYGLHSFYDPKEAWAVMTSDWGGKENGLQILNDTKFEKAVVEQAIIAIVYAKNGVIPIEKLHEYLGSGEIITDYLTAFNFFFFSDRTKKFYTSITFPNGDFYDEDCTNEGEDVFMELYHVHNFGKLTAEAISFVKAHTAFFDKYSKEEVMDKMLEAYWNHLDD